MALAFLLGGVRLASAAPAGAWRTLPINGGGFIQSVEIAPSDPNVWYSYVDVGGPYRSDDAGRTWRPLHGNMPQTRTVSSAFDFGPGAGLVLGSPGFAGCLDDLRVSVGVLDAGGHQYAARTGAVVIIR